MPRLLFWLAGCCLLATATLPAGAQSRTYSARSWVQSPHAQAMGGAAVAFPNPQAVFFYNPAHVLQMPVSRSPIVMLGINGSFSDNAWSQYDFFRDRLQPALATGLSNLEPSAQRTLLEEATEHGGQRTFAGGDLLLPSFALNRKTYGFGGGLFATTEARYLIDAADPNAPVLDFFSQIDLMVVATGALDMTKFGFPGLSAGLSGTYTQRFLLLKNKPIKVIGEDENYHVLGGNALGMDLGVNYRLPLSLPGDVYVGGVLYDALSTPFNYQFRRFYTKNNPDGDPTTLEAELTLAEERLPFKRTYRLGAAYQSPFFEGAVRSLGVAVDYVGDPGLAGDRGLASHYRLGMQMELGERIALRGGLRGGQPTFGGGLHLDFMQMDYAYYHMQEPGLPEGWHHTIQITLGSF